MKQGPQADCLRPFSICALVGGGVQPVVEAVDNGHERGLVQIAADSGGDPRFVAVGVEADGDADMGGGILRGHVDRGDGEGAEAHVRDRRIPLLQFLTHGLGERVYRTGSLGTRGDYRPSPMNSCIDA